MIISEKESKLLIDNQHGSRVIDDLKKMDNLGAFALLRGVSNEIRDAYFDTKEFDLARKSAYLRIRGRKDGHYITFRTIKSGASNDAVIDETTHPLDDKGIRMALDGLAEIIKLKGSPQLTLPYFKEILESVGIEEVLRVHIQRVEREIFLEEIKIGRMKMDTFQYLSPLQFGPFFEIEVDSYKQALHKSAADFFSALKTRFGDMAEVSGTSKYIRGINIEHGLTL